MTGPLLAVAPDGTMTEIVNDYEHIRDAVGGSIDFVFTADEVGFFVHDEGLLLGFELNVPASLVSGRALYGTAVLTRGQPDDEGDTLPADEAIARALLGAAERWISARMTAAAAGQSLSIFANPDTVTGPTFIELPDNWLPGDPIPGVPS